MVRLGSFFVAASNSRICNLATNKQTNKRKNTRLRGRIRSVVVVPCLNLQVNAFHSMFIQIFQWMWGASLCQTHTFSQNKPRICYQTTVHTLPYNVLDPSSKLGSLNNIIIVNKTAYAFRNHSAVRSVSRNKWTSAHERSKHAKHIQEIEWKSRYILNISGAICYIIRKYHIYCVCVCTSCCFCNRNLSQSMQYTLAYGKWMNLPKNPDFRWLSFGTCKHRNFPYQSCVPL